MLRDGATDALEMTVHRRRGDARLVLQFTGGCRIRGHAMDRIALRLGELAHRLQQRGLARARSPDDAHILIAARECELRSRALPRIQVGVRERPRRLGRLQDPGSACLPLEHRTQREALATERHWRRPLLHVLVIGTLQSITGSGRSNRTLDVLDAIPSKGQRQHPAHEIGMREHGFGLGQAEHRLLQRVLERGDARRRDGATLACGPGCRVERSHPFTTLPAPAVQQIRACLRSFVGARHQRGTGRRLRGVAIPLGELALDLGAPARPLAQVRRVDRRQLEPAIPIGPHDVIAKPRRLARERRAIDLAEQHLVTKQFARLHRDPCTVVSLGRIRHDGMTVQIGVLVARRVMHEHRRHHRTGALELATRLRSLHRAQSLTFRPVQRLADRGLVRAHQTFIAADFSQDRHALRRRERQIPSGRVRTRRVRAPAEHHTVRQSTLEHRLERRSLDGPAQPEALSAFAKPLTGRRQARRRGRTGPRSVCRVRFRRRLGSVVVILLVVLRCIGSGMQKRHGQHRVLPQITASRRRTTLPVAR